MRPNYQADLKLCSPWPAAARPRDLTRLFRGVSDRKLDEMLRTLVALGQARNAGAGRYAG